MDWLRENWFWLAVAVLFLWMHGKMHRGQGGHGGYAGHTHGREQPSEPTGSDDDTGKEHPHVEH